MDFNKKAADRDKVTAGRVKFEVREATEAKNKDGISFLQLILKVSDSFGNSHFKVKDKIYGHDDAVWRIRQFCEATGLLDLFEAERILPDDIIGAEGECEVKWSNFKATDEKTGETKSVDYLEVVSYISKDSDDFQEVSKRDAAADKWAGQTTSF